MYINNNYLSGIVAEAMLRDEDIYPAYGKAGTIIELAHPTQIMDLGAAIARVVDDEELQHELFANYEYITTWFASTVSLYYPNIDCSDWSKDRKTSNETS